MNSKLYKAVAHGDGKVLGEFLEKQQEQYLLKVTPQGNSVVHIAAKFEQKEIVKKILIQLKNNITTQLQVVVEDNHDPQPVLLHDFKELLHHKNNEGDTALHVAARTGCSEIVRQLIDADQDEEDGRRIMKNINKELETVLHVAVRNGHFDVVQLILSEKDSSSYQYLVSDHLINRAGESPLFVALEGKFIQIAKYLLENINEENSNCAYSGRNHMNALHVAVVRYADIVSSGKRRDFLEDIITVMVRKYSLAVIEEDDILKWTPLHFAASLGFEDIVELFLTDESLESYKDDLPYKRDKNGMSVLHIAAINGRIEVMEKLIRHCPIICELLNEHDQTALHVAVESGQLKVVNYLLETAVPNFQVYLNNQDKDGNTPLHLAAIFEDFQILQEVLENKKVGSKDGRKKQVYGNIVNNEGLTVLDIVNKKMDSFSSLKKLLSSFKYSNIIDRLTERNSNLRSLMRKVDEINTEMPIYGKGHEQKIQQQQQKKMIKEEEKEENKLGHESSKKIIKDHSKDNNVTKKINDEEENYLNRSTQFAANSNEARITKRMELKRARAEPKKEKNILLKEFGHSVFDMIRPKMVKKASESDMLIATIIATVTFAAAFQVPGGYQSEGRFQGLPVFKDEIGFKYFIIWDCMAFGLSSCSILLHFLAAKGGEDSTYSNRLLHRAMASTFYSILAMVAAFISAIQLVSTANSKALQAAPYVCAVAFVFFLIYDTLIRCLLGLCYIFKYPLLYLLAGGKGFILGIFFLLFNLGGIAFGVALYKWIITSKH